MSKYSLRWWSGSIVFFAMAIVLAWDIVAFSSGGLDATVSSILAGYIGVHPEPLPSFILGFVIGMFVCHLTGWWMIPRKWRSQVYDINRQD